MKLPISLFIIFLIVSPFAAYADFTTFSAYDNNGNTFSATTTRIGDSTFTSGYNNNTSFNTSQTRIGGTSLFSGTTSDGDYFSSTQYNFDNDYDSDFDLDF